MDVRRGGAGTARQAADRTVATEAGKLAAQGASAQLQAMAKAAQQVDQAGQTLAGIRRQVAAIAAGTAAGYQSEAGTTFRNAMDQWTADFQTIVNGLDQIQAALTANKGTYQASIDADRGSAGTIFNALNGGR
jgi:WXG100 family type VII secretion target